MGDIALFSELMNSQQYDAAIGVLESLSPVILDKNFPTINTHLKELLSNEKYDVGLRFARVKLLSPTFRLRRKLLQTEIVCSISLDDADASRSALQRWHSDPEYPFDVTYTAYYGIVLYALGEYRDAARVAQQGLDTAAAQNCTDSGAITQLNKIISAANEEIKRIERELLEAEEKELAKKKEIADQQERDELERQQLNSEAEYNERQLKRKNDDLEEHIPVVEEDKITYQPAKRQKFPLVLEVDMSTFLGGTNPSIASCVKGSISTTHSRLVNSFVVASDIQIKQIEELVKICAKHQCLLTVFLSFNHDVDLLIAESVVTVDDFFQRRFEKLQPNSSEEWWNDIENVFWQIFRDISQGLLYLAKSGTSCGRVAFQCYVTEDERGRVLPSLVISKDEGDDVREFGKLMSSVTKMFKEDADLSTFLPYSLLQFFAIASNDLLRSSITHLFLLDHSYFWNKSEKINYAPKLRKLVKDPGLAAEVINTELQKCKTYNNWEKLLPVESVYYAVWDYGQKHKKCKYFRDIDLSRYIMAVYTHVNEGGYKGKRKMKKTLTDAAIEHELIETFFPNFYADVFSSVCYAALQDSKAIGEEQLLALTTFHQEDLS